MKLSTNDCTNTGAVVMLKFDSYEIKGPIPKTDFKGLPKAAVLTILKSDVGTYTAVGRCPFCGVIGMWPNIILIDGQPDRGHIFKCNCTKCAKQWKLDNGKVIVR